MSPLPLPAPGPGNHDGCGWCGRRAQAGGFPSRWDHRCLVTGNHHIVSCPVFLLFKGPCYSVLNELITKQTKQPVRSFMRFRTGGAFRLSRLLVNTPLFPLLISHTANGNREDGADWKTARWQPGVGPTSSSCLPASLLVSLLG